MSVDNSMAMSLMERAARAEEQVRVMREQLSTIQSDLGGRSWGYYGAYRGKKIVFSEDHCARIDAALATPAPAQSLLERIDQVAVEMKATPDWKKGSPINERTPAPAHPDCPHHHPFRKMTNNGWEFWCEDCGVLIHQPVPSAVNVSATPAHTEGK